MKYRYIIIAALSLLLCITGYGQEVKISVDERVELVCIAARLAGYEEYVCDSAPAYMDDIDRYFSGYADDSLVLFLNRMRETSDLAYNAIVQSAYVLDIKDGDISIDEDDAGFLLARDCRWTEKALREYADLLDRFYKRSRFREFFDSHASMYSKAVELAGPYMENIDMSWFSECFGYRPACLTVCLGLSIGRSNYSISSIYNGDRTDNVIIVMGCNSEVEGVPAFANDNAVPVLIHEIAHAYTAPLVRECYPEISASADTVFNSVKDMITSAHAEPEIMAGESINEQFVIMYMMDCEALRPYAMYRIAQDQDAGYLWMERAARFMENFRRNRDKYPSAKDFMPHIVDFYNSLPANWDLICNEYRSSSPYVIETFPVAGSTITPDTEEIRIVFSRNMLTSAFGTVPAAGYPLLRGSLEWLHNRTLVLRPDGPLLQGEYGIGLMRYAFIAMNGHRMKEDYILHYKVK